ncbi:TVP38/TMEM64 family protein [Stieleria varia]|uniref:TVP38/TMEM64 family membrane protein n=1 Tax=Stieleria varia TaxID=2528005 RepID=A0A5C6B7X3_9BACT|nr:TVP38/TMEM64 family protein [Stieleria varia]TWU07521.1 SNARE associated Golgi protein [Stieleria varia]
MTDATESPKSFPITKVLVLLGVGLIATYAYLRYGDSLTLENLAGHETALRNYRIDHPILVYAVAFGIYVGVTGLSLPGAAVLTLVMAWYFGFARAMVLVSFASTTGATVAFLLSRFLLRDTIQSRFGDRLATFNENLEREGAFYLFTLRLIPAVPFFVINVVMGLTPMKTWTFWWVSQLGMLAGTAVYVYAGASFPTLNALAENGAGGILSWKLIVAFIALGLFPLAAKKIIGSVKRNRGIETRTTDDAREHAEKGISSEQ